MFEVIIKLYTYIFDKIMYHKVQINSKYVNFNTYIHMYVCKLAYKISDLL